jgi:hypothetical protein
MIPADKAASLPPAVHDSRASDFAWDALSFLGLATAVALGAAAILSVLVLLLAAPDDATPAAESSPLSRPAPSARPAAAQCAPAPTVTVGVQSAEPAERCQDLMRIPNAPQAIPARGLLRVRAPHASRRRSA